MGDQASGHQAIATVEVSIIESTWVPLEPIHLAENLKVLYPHHIAQVHWSGVDVHYRLESHPLGPFDVDAEGNLYVTRELDTEAQAEYVLQVWAQNSRGEDYAAPLELHVLVMDENDNVPVCPPRGPAVSIPELSPPGTEVTRLSAEDADAPGSPNSHIVYQLLNPESEDGVEGRAFQVDSTSGSVTLGALPLQAGQNILLLVLAMDLAGAEGGFSSTCEVEVEVTDINDHAPEFTTSQIGPISLPEDVEPGTLVAMLTATDADLEPAFRLMDFAIERGDMDGTFDLDWEPDSGHVGLRLCKNLSYEAAPSHKVVVVVRSVAELVGPGPGPGATATVTVLVERVMPPPKLDQERYEASVPISAPAGSLLLTIQPSDPISRSLRFSLVNDSEGWLCIEKVSGKVHTAQSLQGTQPGDTYTVLVEAQDTGLASAPLADHSPRSTCKISQPCPLAPGGPLRVSASGTGTGLGRWQKDQGLPRGRSAGVNGPLEPGRGDSEHCSGQRAGPCVGSPGRQVSALSWAVIQGRPSSSELCYRQGCPQWHGDDDR
ncbi:cadherin-16 isoform X9 [Macaca fascicularis]